MGEIAEHYQLTRIHLLIMFFNITHHNCPPERTIPSDPKEAIKEFPEWIAEADARGSIQSSYSLFSLCEPY